MVIRKINKREPLGLAVTGLNADYPPRRNIHGEKEIR
jgi:hypothetical protein